VNKDYIQLIVWAVVVLGIFAFMWRKGHLLRLSNYIQETKEELRKCTWPSWDELKGSTVVVMISIAIMGAFTVGVDLVLTMVVRWMMQA
jgi:preprotein translocase subunit SecE